MIKKRYYILLSLLLWFLLPVFSQEYILSQEQKQMILMQLVAQDAELKNLHIINTDLNKLIEDLKQQLMNYQENETNIYQSITNLKKELTNYKTYTAEQEQVLIGLSSTIGELEKLLNHYQRLNKIKNYVISVLGVLLVVFVVI